MNCLIVFAHPAPDSLCARLAGVVRDTLLDHGHTVVFDDLYANDFDPVMTTQERRKYYDNDVFPQSLDSFARRLEQSEALILVFPTWWFGFPAILKGWFDRIWVPGVAFDRKDEGHLRNLRRTLIVTTLNSSFWLERLLIGQPIRHTVKRVCLTRGAPKAKFKMMPLYQAQAVTQTRLLKFEKALRNELSGWEK